MVGDPSQDAREIYTAHLVQKRKAGADPAADSLIGRTVALDAVSPVRIGHGGCQVGTAPV
jgi:hypothetical protein